MSDSKPPGLTDGWTDQEITELQERVSAFEKKRAVEKAPVGFMIKGAAVFDIALILFADMFFPASKGEVIPFLVAGLLAIGFAAFIFVRLGVGARYMEAERIIAEINRRRRS